MNNFWIRTLTGALFVAVMIFSAKFIALLPIVFIYIILIGESEYYSLLEKNNYHPQMKAGMIISMCILTLGTAGCKLGNLDDFFRLLSLSFVFLISPFFIELFRNKPNPFQNISLTILGILYVAFPIILLYALVINPNNTSNRNLYPNILLGYYFLIWSNDTFAYLVGISIGKHRLFERISPKKSWEGFIGGIICTQGIAYIISIYFTELAPIHWYVVALITSVFGTLGDLVESMFKRSMGVKDSGNFLPGHGGILDRFDGVLLSSPFVVAYLMLIR
jgi:phosphatidate cytidylyltransferase